MRTRPIPSTGEQLPVIGLGTYGAFDVADGDTGGPLQRVLDALFAGGGRVIDTSPMYGRSETVVGDLLARRHRQNPFLATKVWTRGRQAGIRQLEHSFDLLGADVVDLVEVHNLVDWRVQLETLRDWKDEGRLRYIGITHYAASAYDDVEEVLKSEPLDFLQINYSLAEPEAEERLLPLAEDRGVAVLANRPLGGGALARALAHEPLPGWAADAGLESWPALALAWVVSHPAVTCAIPGTGNPAHMKADVAAGAGEPLEPGRRSELSALAQEV